MIYFTSSHHSHASLLQFVPLEGESGAVTKLVNYLKVQANNARFGVPHVTEIKSETRKGFWGGENDNGLEQDHCGMIFKRQIAKVMNVFLNWNLLRIAELSHAYQNGMEMRQ